MPLVAPTASCEDEGSPYLPPELVCEILQLAASSKVPSAARLCCVARWVQELTLPHLHRICQIEEAAGGLLIRTHPERHTLQHSLIASKPNLGKHVEGLWSIDDACNCEPPSFPLKFNETHKASAVTTFMSVLNNCPNVHHIAFRHLTSFLGAFQPGFTCRTLSADFLSKRHALHLTVVNLSSIAALSSRARIPGINLLLDRITHLCITGIQDSPARYVHLRYMRALTHLTIPYASNEADFAPCVFELGEQHLRHLQMMVIIVDPRVHVPGIHHAISFILDHLRKKSPKFFLLKAEVLDPPYTDESRDGRHVLREIWEEEVKGGPTIWELAEEQTSDSENELRSIDGSEVP